VKIAVPFFALGAWIASATLTREEVKPAPVSPPAASSEPAPAVANPSTPSSNAEAETTREAVTPVLPPDPREVEADRIAAEAVAGTESAASLSREERMALLRDALGADAAEKLAFETLDVDVMQLRETLEAMIGNGPDDTKPTLLRVPGFEDELERIGIAAEIADEIRALYPQVQALRGELLMRDLQTGQLRSDFTAVSTTNATHSESPSSGEDAAHGGKVAPVLGPRPRTNQPKFEAELCFHAGDVDGALEILSQMPRASSRHARPSSTARAWSRSVGSTKPVNCSMSSRRTIAARLSRKPRVVSSPV
jgi:hypothetical protein